MDTHTEQTFRETVSQSRDGILSYQVLASLASKSFLEEKNFAPEGTSLFSHLDERLFSKQLSEQESQQEVTEVVYHIQKEEGLLMVSIQLNFLCASSENLPFYQTDSS